MRQFTIKTYMVGVRPLPAKLRDLILHLYRKLGSKLWQHHYNHNYYVNMVKLWETLFNGFENCWYNFRWRQRKQSFHLYNVFPWLINGLKDGKYKFFPQNTLFEAAMSLKLSDNKILHFQRPQLYVVIENGSLHLIFMLFLRQ